MVENIIDNDTSTRVVTPEELDGVRTARVMAFFLDYIIIALLSIPVALVIGVYCAAAAHRIVPGTGIDGREVFHIGTNIE